MPILASYIKPPTVPTPRGFAPAGGFAYKVATGDTWAKLASAAGVAPWTLIRYNFPALPADRREAIKEVNWYLQNYIGCTNVTTDSTSFHFNSLDTPGQIYLPNSIILTSMARNRIVNILTNSYTKRVTFIAGYRSILGVYYQAVADAVRTGRIGINYDPNIGHMAYYDYVDPDPAGAPGGRFTVSGTTSESLLVHEATHAVFDHLKATIPNNENESICYIAQHMYDRLKYGAPSSRYLVSRDPKDPMSEIAWQTIFDEASRLAEIAVSQTWIPPEECVLLFGILPVANVYRAKGTTTYTYDGI